MLLWDSELANDQELLDRLNAQQCLAVAVASLAWTIESLPQPIETSAIREYLATGLTCAQQAVDTGNARVRLPDDIAARFEEVDELADEPGTTHFLAALMILNDGVELDAELLYGILSYCYEGSLDREDLAEWSPEMERQNQRSLDVIEFQKALIRRAVESSA